jgi:hypothetical protein
MILVSIPSESCPHCETPNGICSIMVQEADTLRAWDINIREKDFLTEMTLGTRKKEREAYVFHSFVCLHGKGKI